MPKTKEDIHRSAVEFVGRWRGRGHESGETQLFYRDLFAILDVHLEDEPEAVFEAPTTRVTKAGVSGGYADLLWKGRLLVEQKSRGGDLDEAFRQATSYFPDEPPPRILVCNFQEFRLYDLRSKAPPSIFALEDLPEHIQLFAEIAGEEETPPEEEHEDPNEEATKLLADLCDEIEQDGHDEESMARFLARIVFCLFADSTDIFRLRQASEENRRTSKGRFWRLLAGQAESGSGEIHTSLAQLFRVLSATEDGNGKKWREKFASEEMRQFPYINGRLFKDDCEVPRFSPTMLENLLRACRFRWSKISPAIFGSLFQFVMGKDRRRKLGGHYTTEENILKVIGPLFLDDLKGELESICARKGPGRKKALEDFQRRLSEMKFLDPACGCGNFLVITYRELRLLEMRVLDELFPDRNLRVLDASKYSLLHVHQFHGIEVDEFSARIAETALWMMDHQMNQMLGRRFGVSYARIPLEGVHNIHKEDALDIDWNEVLPAGECSFVFGNPPFEGFSKRDAERGEQVRKVAKALGNGGRRLDFVALWFLKAAEYIQQGSAQVGFVATDSITQGEHPLQVWEPLLHRWNLEISFAHRSFLWLSDIDDAASVRVVIVGFAKRGKAPEKKRLFHYERDSSLPFEEIQARNISPYLFPTSSEAASRVVVRRSSKPLGSDLPVLGVGSKPVDDGRYILSLQEKDALLEREPAACDLVHPYVGAHEFLNESKENAHKIRRWILYFGDRTREEIAERFPEANEHILAVERYRLDPKSGNLAASLASTPTRYHKTVVPEGNFFVLPEASSSNREYIPMGWLEKGTIPSNQLYVSEKVSSHLFALLTSRMHMTWVRTIGGRLKSDFRYSARIIYNNFPLPRGWQEEEKNLDALAKGVLSAREALREHSYADLYDPKNPKGLELQALHRAHEENDAFVERMYRPKRKFTAEHERLESLFSMYEKRQALPPSELDPFVRAAT